MEIFLKKKRPTNERIRSEFQRERTSIAWRSSGSLFDDRSFDREKDVDKKKKRKEKKKKEEEGKRRKFSLNRRKEI